MTRRWIGPNRWAFVARSLRIQLRIFFAICLVLVGLVVMRLVRDEVAPGWIVAGFGAGLALGLVLSRVKVLRWNATYQEVVGTTDALGTAILAAYLLFLVVRGRIIGAGVDDAETVGATALAMTAGTMRGRVVVTRRGIRRLLREALTRTPPPA